MFSYRQTVGAYLALVLGMLALLVWQLHVAPNESFFGEKAGLIDIWVPGHFLFGVILMGCWDRLVRRDHFLWVLVSICVWESVEFPMEIGLMGPGPKRWMAGIEPPVNRYLIDPFVGVLGAVTCRRFPKIWFPSFVVGLMFEAANVASLTAMTIQQNVLDLLTP